jgi:hypothetical protein
MKQPLTESACPTCHATLSRALLRDVRHYEETRLVEVTCVHCENSFFAVMVDGAGPDPVREDDVLMAAAMLADARALSDILSPNDLSLDEAA